MSRRTRKASNPARGRRGKLADFSTLVEANNAAILDGPQRKRWTRHDLRTIQPMTPAQEDMFHDFLTGQNLCATGSAGTGKTYIAVYLALNELLASDSPIDRIIIVRSAVASRDIGFLPGTEEEKQAVYERPYKPMFHDFIGRASTYDDMKAAGKVEFMTTSYVRGVTWDNAVVILDEVQNMNWHEIDSVMTRLGVNSRVIAVGDRPQTDLIKNKSDQSGFDNLIKVTQRMGQFSTVTFTSDDIVRGPFVKSWIKACEEVLY